MFQSLQRGYAISSNDIESAIALCDENVIEIPITQLLKHICSHFTVTKQVDSTHNHMFADGVPITPSKNVKFANVAETPPAGTQDTDGSPAKQKRIRYHERTTPHCVRIGDLLCCCVVIVCIIITVVIIGSSSSDSSPKSRSPQSPISITVPYADLFDRPCDSSVSSFAIKAKFLDVLGGWFKPVPSCKDVFYYCPDGYSDRQVSVSASVIDSLCGF